MDKPIAAHFDGTAIVPDEPLELHAGQRLQVRIELAQENPARFDGLRNLARHVPDAPHDFARHHDHYLYGHEKQ